MADNETLWHRYCDRLLWDRSLGIMLDLSRLEFSPDYFARMQPSMERALAAMQALENGSIANADENRMVGHYWLRKAECAPDPAIGRDIRDALQSVQNFAHGVHSGRIRGASGPFTHALVIGIGGSALGPQLLSDALAGKDDAMTIQFLDNTDPDGFDHVLGQLSDHLDRTLVIVISKSGGTPETRNGMLEVQEAYRRNRLPFARHAVAVTQSQSSLDQTARAGDWLARFPMWDWVGGRTSITSTVGLLPAALQGIDTEAFLEGAAAMDGATRQPDVTRNPAALLALVWFHATAGEGGKDMVILPYKDRLALLARYMQQLVMESLGKEKDRAGAIVRQGITVYGNKGSTDQHSYVQQLRDGLTNFFVTFIEVLRDRSGPPFDVEKDITSGDYLSGFLHGTRQALYENGRESITLTLDDVTAVSMGQLIALFERTVGLYAELINVNAYHQPGVQAGKVAAQSILDVQRQALSHLRTCGTSMTAQQLATAIGRPDQAEIVFHILRHLAANQQRGVMIGEGDSPRHVAFQSIPI